MFVACWSVLVAVRAIGRQTPPYDGERDREVNAGYRASLILPPSART
jgi:hypothetical protein